MVRTKQSVHEQQKLYGKNPGGELTRKYGGEVPSQIHYFAV